MARGSSSIARFDPVTPTAALRDAPTDGWVLWWWSAFSADHRLHAAISPPSVPTEAMESAGSMLKGWDLTDLGKPGARPRSGLPLHEGFTSSAHLKVEPRGGLGRRHGGWSKGGVVTTAADGGDV